MLKISCLCMGNKMPDWVNTAWSDYAKRLQEAMPVRLIELPLIKRNKESDQARILDREADLLLQNIPKDAYVIALDKDGKTFSSEGLAKQLSQLEIQTQSICLIIGGPEGLMPKVLQRCQEKWSLSALTLPHPLARIVLIESLYRAWSINQNHPYHK